MTDETEKKEELNRQADVARRAAEDAAHKVKDAFNPRKWKI